MKLSSVFAVIGTAFSLAVSAIAAGTTVPLPMQVTIHPIYVQTDVGPQQQTAVVTAGYAALLPQFQEATQKIFAQAGIRLIWETPTTFASTDCYDLNTGIADYTFNNAKDRALEMGSDPASYGGSISPNVINLWFTGEQDSIVAQGYPSNNASYVVPGATVSQSVFKTPYALDVIAQALGNVLGLGNVVTFPDPPNLMCIGYAGASSIAQITANRTTGLDILTSDQIAELYTSSLVLTNSKLGGDSYTYSATHYIRAGATGARDGSSWANAWPSFSAVTWARGEVYYVAVGIYTEDVTVAALPFESQWITIRKATDAENWADPGWSTSYGDQAVINGTVTLNYGYIELNGVTDSDVSGHGIKINNPASTTVLNLASSTGTGPYTISHCEVCGSGHASATAFDGISSVNTSTPQKNLTIGNCWIHEVSHNGVTLAGLVGTSYGDYGLLFANNVVSEIGGGAAAGQGMQLGAAAEDGFTIISGNKFRNISGTAMLAWLGGSGSNHHDAKIYNNLFYITDLATYSTLSSGAITSDATAVAATNLAVENNTFYGLGSLGHTTANGRVNISTPGATAITLVNNLWENCYFPAVHVGISVESNNGYYGNTGIPPAGTANQVDGAGTTLANVAAENFHLVSGGYAIGQGQTLNSEFTTDFDGLVRGGLWDLGAYQFQTTKGTPVVTALPTASGIPWGQLLSVSTLTGGSASVPGAFAFTLPYSVPTAGNYPASVTFTPTDTDNYNTVTCTVSVAVSYATASIRTPPTASAITYGQALSASTLSGGTGSVDGTFAFTTPTAIPSVDTASVSITFTPTDTNHSTATTTISVTVNKATPTISWPTPAAIASGTALSATQLNATASAPYSFDSVPGTFVYNPTAGTVLATGDHSVSVTFTPTDTTNFSDGASGSATITVNTKLTPRIDTAPTAAAITYGQALSNSHLSGGAASVDGPLTVTGTFTFTTPTATPNWGTFLVGITFTPNDTDAYNAATTTISITVNKATSTVSWPPPAAITYGTALSATQLKATASVPGTFVYSPVSGTVLGAGVGQTLSVTFTPTNTNYTTATKTVSLTVNQATPTVSWSAPAAITYGTALSGTQLNATASVPGNFVYSLVSGTVLGAGASQALSVAFTPTDNANYNGASGSTTITVNKATPTVSWSTPAAITYGTALSATQLSATASVPGAFAYTPDLGTVLTVGNGQALTVKFTPTDTDNYNTVVRSTTISVKTTPSITTSPMGSAITYGQALSASTLSNGVASVAGAFAYTTPTTMPSAGTYSAGITFTPTDTTNYTTTTGTITITVNKATPTITTSPTGSAITYGQALSASTLSSGVASVAGSFAYTASATTPSAGTPSVGITFMPTDTTNYTTATGTITITVNQATQTISFTGPGNQAFSTSPIALSATASSGLTVTFSVFSGPASVSSSTLTLTGAGTVVVRASQAGNGNYQMANYVDRSFTVSANFASWKQSMFTAGELADPNKSGPNAVYGLDGLTNLTKYALGLEPKQNITSGLPELAIVGGNYTYTYSRPSTITDVTYSVEA